MQARFSQNAHRYDLASEVQKILAERLLLLAQNYLPTGEYADLGAGTGHLTRLLAAQQCVQQIRALDISAKMLEKLATSMDYSPGKSKLCLEICDAETWNAPTPLAALFSSAALQWFKNVRIFCQKLPLLMAPGGLVALASFGPASLRELRMAYIHSQGRNLITGARYITTTELLENMHLGSCTPLVWESALYSQSWSSPREYLRSLRNMGVTSGEAHNLPGPRALQSLEEALCKEMTADGKILCTWEMVWAIGRMHT